MGYDKTWYVDSDGHKTVLPLWSVVTECTYLILHLHICSDWLKQKKVKYPDFCMGYIDETWYVGSDGHKYYPCGLLSPNVHIQYLICIPVLIG